MTITTERLAIELEPGVYAMNSHEPCEFKDAQFFDETEAQRSLNYCWPDYPNAKIVTVKCEVAQ